MAMVTDLAEVRGRRTCLHRARALKVVMMGKLGHRHLPRVKPWPKSTPSDWRSSKLVVLGSASVPATEPPIQTLPTLLCWSLDMSHARSLDLPAVNILFLLSWAETMGLVVSGVVRVLLCGVGDWSCCCVRSVSSGIACTFAFSLALDTSTL